MESSIILTSERAEVLKKALTVAINNAKTMHEQKEYANMLYMVQEVTRTEKD